MSESVLNSPTSNLPDEGEMEQAVQHTEHDIGKIQSKRARDRVYCCHCSDCQGRREFKLETVAFHYKRDKDNAGKFGKESLLRNISNDIRETINLGQLSAGELFDLTNKGQALLSHLESYRQDPEGTGKFVGVNSRNTGLHYDSDGGGDATGSGSETESVYEEMAEDEDAIADGEVDDEHRSVQVPGVNGDISTQSASTPPSGQFPMPRRMQQYWSDEDFFIWDGSSMFHQDHVQSPSISHRCTFSTT